MRSFTASTLVLLAIWSFLPTPSAARGRDERAELPFSEARIYFEYNASANDLGVHVFLDAEDWRSLKIESPSGRKLFAVEGKGPYKLLGMTELFFEGAEPSLDDVPLEELLALFPEGEYEFEGRTVEGDELESDAALSHAIPAGPANVAASLAGNSLVLSWSRVTSPPPGFPDEEIEISGYQVIVDSFQVTVSADTTSVTVPPEFVAELDPGLHAFEVLAIDASGNQSITEGSFTK